MRPILRGAVLPRPPFVLDRQVRTHRPVLAPVQVDVRDIALPMVADGADDVGRIDAGALLAALETLDTTTLSDHDALEQLAAWRKLENAVTARRLALASRFRERAVPGTAWVSGREFAADEIAARLVMPRSMVEADLSTAWSLEEELPELGAACADGRVDARRAAIVADGCCHLPPAARAAVERELLPEIERLAPASVKRRLHRLVLEVDPAGVEERRREQLARRYVGGSIAEDGMADLHARLGAAEWLTVRRAIDAAARRLRRDGDPRTLDQLKADALVAPFAEALRTGVLSGLPDVRLGTHVPLTLDLTTTRAVLAGDSQAAGDLDGYGPLPAQAVRDLVAGAWSIRTVDDGDVPRASAVDGSASRYRPAAVVARTVVRRDRTCRFPGCEHPASACDLDHTVPFPLGRTEPDNLGALCRRHHRLKHESGAHLTQDGEGRFTWTMPTGHRFIVNPPAHAPPHDPVT